jgi:hypothetical protein
MSPPYRHTGYSLEQMFVNTWWGESSPEQSRDFLPLLCKRKNGLAQAPIS